MARTKTTMGHPVEALREMGADDYKRAAEWEHSPERQRILDRNRAIQDNISQISATYSNRV